MAHIVHCSHTLRSTSLAKSISDGPEQDLSVSGKHSDRAQAPETAVVTVASGQHSQKEASAATQLEHPTLPAAKPKPAPDTGWRLRRSRRNKLLLPEEALAAVGASAKSLAGKTTATPSLVHQQGGTQAKPPASDDSTRCAGDDKLGVATKTGRGRRRIGRSSGKQVQRPQQLEQAAGSCEVQEAEMPSPQRYPPTRAAAAAAPGVGGALPLDPAAPAQRDLDGSLMQKLEPPSVHLPQASPSAVPAAPSWKVCRGKRGLSGMDHPAAADENAPGSCKPCHSFQAANRTASPDAPNSRSELAQEPPASRLGTEQMLGTSTSGQAALPPVSCQAAVQDQQRPLPLAQTPAGRLRSSGVAPEEERCPALEMHCLPAAPRGPEPVSPGPSMMPLRPAELAHAAAAAFCNPRTGTAIASSAAGMAAAARILADIADEPANPTAAASSSGQPGQQTGAARRSPRGGAFQLPRALTRRQVAVAAAASNAGLQPALAHVHAAAEQQPAEGLSADAVEPGELGVFPAPALASASHGTAGLFCSARTGQALVPSAAGQQRAAELLADDCGAAISSRAEMDQQGAGEAVQHMLELHAALSSAPSKASPFPPPAALENASIAAGRLFCSARTGQPLPPSAGGQRRAAAIFADVELDSGDARSGPGRARDHRPELCDPQAACAAEMGEPPPILAAAQLATASSAACGLFCSARTGAALQPSVAARQRAAALLAEVDAAGPATSMDVPGSHQEGHQPEGTAEWQQPGAAEPAEPSPFPAPAALVQASSGAGGLFCSARTGNAIPASVAGMQRAAAVLAGVADAPVTHPSTDCGRVAVSSAFKRPTLQHTSSRTAAGRAASSRPAEADPSSGAWRSGGVQQELGAGVHRGEPMQRPGIQMPPGHEGPQRSQCPAVGEAQDHASLGTANVLLLVCLGNASLMIFLANVQGVSPG